MLLARPSDGGFSASGAHGLYVRCAPVLEATTSRLTPAHSRTVSEVQARLPYSRGIAAIISISTLAPSGKAATPMVERAG
jgi:hypothetical protein